MLFLTFINQPFLNIDRFYGTLSEFVMSLRVTVGYFWSSLHKHHNQAHTHTVEEVTLLS